jgi:hypothetical protein
MVNVSVDPGVTQVRASVACKGISLGDDCEVVG